MTANRFMLGSAAIVAIAFFGGEALSAPLQNTASYFNRAEAPDRNFVRVQHRLCVTEGGVRQCRMVEIYGPGQQSPGLRGGYGYQSMSQPMYGYQAPIAVDRAYPPASYGYAPVGGYLENYTERSANPDFYPTGSHPWWESMDKQGRGGQGY